MWTKREILGFEKRALRFILGFKEDILGFIDTRVAEHKMTTKSGRTLTQRIKKKFRYRKKFIEGDLFNGYPGLLTEFTEYYSRIHGIPMELPKPKKRSRLKPPKRRI